MFTLDQLRSNRDALFWTLHAAGWGAYAIAQYFGALLIEKSFEYQLVIGIAAVAGLRAVDADAVHLSRAPRQAAARGDR